MAKKKQILVSDILNLMNDADKVCVILYAYGIYYGDTHRDEMFTVEQCKAEMNHNCINALVTRIRTDEQLLNCTIIQAEIVH